MTETTAETTQVQGTETTTAEPQSPTSQATARKSDRTQGQAESAGSDAEGKGGGLAGLKMAQLQALAQQLGITGSSRMRKSALVEAISAHQRGGAVADRQDREKKSNEQKANEKESPKSAEKQEDASAEKGRSRRNGRAAQSEAGTSEAPEAEKQQKSQDDQAQRGSDQGSDQGSEQSGGSKQQKQDQQKGQNRNRRNRGRGDDQPQKGGQNEGQQKGGGQQKDRPPKDRQQKGGGQSDGDGRGPGGGDGGGRGGDGRDGNRNRRSRNRNDRSNRRRGRNEPEVDDTEVTEDDVLVPVAGILDVLDNYAFIRTSGYLPGQNDVYVSLAQVKRYTLRKGDAVHGHIRAPREGENPNKRQKFNALVKLESVNGRPAENGPERVDFSKLVPLYPQERLRLEGDPKEVGTRVIDLVAPVGKGQRGLIVSPPKAGKTLILQSLAQAIKTNNPEVHLMMVLVDERPEEVTDMQRTVDGEVIASTFDRPADDHTTVAELAIERAKRLVELGKDVVVLLDSMTRLGRAYNQAAPTSGRILSGGVDASALYPPKRFFGAARNIEHGGSLTILATALVETGSKMDEVIFEEFKGTGNMELRLSRHLADRRIFPAVDVNASSTRREENLLSRDEITIMWKLRRVLSGLEQQQGLELLINKLKDTGSNAEFLLLANKTTLGDKNKKD